MKCPKCQTENPEAAKFCLECGVKLELTCSQCGHSLPPSAKFCDQCGNKVGKSHQPFAVGISTPSLPRHLAERILNSKASLEGERKQVTVLFADLKGSMELLADRDPEEARKLLDPIVKLMMDAVHHYEGTVNQVMGDGLMALFGAPLAHEDHAPRACYAALRMQEAIRRHSEDLRRSHGIEIQIRVGLNSGEVVVGAIGSDLRMEYTAVGQTTHLAARMEQLASPGTIRLTDNTLRFGEAFIEVQPLGPVPVKGIAQPVEIYELKGARSVRTRLQSAVVRGLSKFVGRDTEIEQLQLALEQAGQSKGQIVGVVGEPGVGKSRLFYEFVHSHRTQGWLALEAGSVSYGKATPYLPVIDLLKAYFQIHDRDNHREIQERVTGKLLTLDPALGSTRDAFLSLFDVPVASWNSMDPLQKRQQTFEAVKRLLLRESQFQPLLLVFEDLHWIDGETQLLLDSLVESLPAARILLLVNYRPEYTHRWGSKTYYRQIRLDTLQPQNTTELLDALVGTGNELAELKRNLIDRTGGNPFFIEESVRTLLETGVLIGNPGTYRLAKETPGIEIPATVQTLLAARIDRLPPEEKDLLQCAAVIGKDVPFRLLNEIAGRSEEDLRRGLAHLQNSEFMYETSLFPELEYTFKHALTYEVAYGSLLQSRRKLLHGQILEAIERIYRERLDDHIEKMGSHAFRGEIWGKASKYLRKAGNRATSRSAFREAANYYEQALKALKNLSESPALLEEEMKIRDALDIALFPLAEFDRGFKNLKEAELQAEKCTNPIFLVRAYGNLCHQYWGIGEHEKAIAYGNRALKLAATIGDIFLQGWVKSVLSKAYNSLGQHQIAVDYNLFRLDQIARRLNEHPFHPLIVLVAVDARMWLTWSLGEMGKFTEAEVRAAEAIEIAERSNHLYSIYHAYNGRGYLFVYQGDWTNAVNFLQKAVSICELANFPYMYNATIALLGYSLACNGKISEGIHLLEDSVEKTKIVGMMFFHTMALFYLGEAYLIAGQIEKAMRTAKRVQEMCQKFKTRGYEAWSLRLLGNISSHPENLNYDGAKGAFQQAMELGDSLGMRLLVAHCHMDLGKLYFKSGEKEKAQEYLGSARKMFREMGMNLWLERAEKDIKELSG